MGNAWASPYMTTSIVGENSRASMKGLLPVEERPFSKGRGGKKAAFSPTDSRL
ncbi:hypothetical protein [Mesorhizobium norvegicum]|uniref:hypothetical protein n=1 Tax=Mesorhizobium norvegicum TaxID=1085774 RepID=UPI00145A02CA|nr:hypothetical protein [Mesorhizobium norvegicum]